MEPGIMLYINCTDARVENQIETLKEIGVKKTFLAASNPRLEEVMCLVKENDIICETLHGVFNEPDGYTAEDLHKPGEAGDIMLERLINNISNCVIHGVPILVLHLPGDNISNVKNEYSELRYKKLGDFARKNGITLAFENTGKCVENFKYILNLIPDAKFCWDNAHQSLFAGDEKFLPLFSDKLVALHITDNNLCHDDHLIPFDGKIDFDVVAKTLAAIGYDGTIMLELLFRDSYAETMSYKDYALKAKFAAERIIEMVKKYRNN